MKTPLTQVLVVILATLTPALSWGVNPHDEYYADDIFTAIDEARKRPHHYDYSTAKRYNRSTTQSLDIPRILNREMGITSIESQVENSVSAEDIPVSEQRQKQYEVNDEDMAVNRISPINTVAPVVGSPNIHSPNVTMRIMAR
jgi:hypothetical protein